MHSMPQKLSLSYETSVIPDVEKVGLSAAALAVLFLLAILFYEAFFC